VPVLGYPVRVDFSAVQIAMVLVIALLVFGPHRLPQIGRQVGRSLREARRQISEVGDEIRRAHPEDTGRTSAPSSSATASGGTQPAVPATSTDGDEDLLAGVVVSRGSTDAPVAQVEQPAPSGDDDLLDGVVLSGDTPPAPREA